MSTTEILNKQEQEALGLLTARTLIKGMVNRGMLQFSSDITNCEVKPQTRHAAELYAIYLIDFFSDLDKPFSKKDKNKYSSLLEYLLSIVNNPSFNFENSIQKLSNSLNQFNDWIEQEGTIDFTDFPPAIKLKMKRKDLFFICGNAAKHHYARLNGVNERLVNSVKAAGGTIAGNAMMKMRTELCELLFEQLFYIHIQKASELLTNIAWAIQTYLTPEYQRAYKVDLEKTKDYGYEVYFFNYPPHINSDLGKNIYWDLMNEVRAKPFIDRFTTYPYRTIWQDVI